MAKTWLLVALVNTLLVFVSNGIRAELLGEANCEDLGFTGLALCSDCDSLAEYVKDQGRTEDQSHNLPLSIYLSIYLSIFFFCTLQNGVSSESQSAISLIVELETDCRKCCTPEAEDAISKVCIFVCFRVYQTLVSSQCLLCSFRPVSVSLSSLLWAFVHRVYQALISSQCLLCIFCACFSTC
jgi:hypothetical protein